MLGAIIGGQYRLARQFIVKTVPDCQRKTSRSTIVSVSLIKRANFSLQWQTLRPRATHITHQYSARLFGKPTTCQNLVVYDECGCTMATLRRLDIRSSMASKSEP